VDEANAGVANALSDQKRVTMRTADAQGKIAKVEHERAALEAARRKFTPEFMNRIDRTVVFRPLGVVELRKILSIELNDVQRRIFSAPNSGPFVVTFTDQARDYLLVEGTDMKYGARHLKRAVDRNVVQPLSNLIATGQVRCGDLIRVDYDESLACLNFFKELEGMPAVVMACRSRVLSSA
jgi:ATP-dependent Clp protease ATP-binding subunit ClpA